MLPGWIEQSHHLTLVTFQSVTHRDPESPRLQNMMPLISLSRPDNPRRSIFHSNKRTHNPLSTQTNTPTPDSQPSKCTQIFQQKILRYGYIPDHHPSHIMIFDRLDPIHPLG